MSFGGTTVEVEFESEVFDNPNLHPCADSKRQFDLISDLLDSHRFPLQNISKNKQPAAPASGFLVHTRGAHPFEAGKGRLRGLVVGKQDECRQKDEALR